MTYDAHNWYWLADDGRVFASARQAIVDRTDVHFASREEAGAVTRWPVDRAGAQTVASMQDEVRRYGLTVPGTPRSASGYALVSVLTDDEVGALSKAKAKDQHLFGKRADPFPEDNPKIARFAAVLNIEPKTWFDRVFAPPVAG